MDKLLKALLGLYVHQSTLQFGGCPQIGYCGLDKQSLGAGPDAGSLDVEDYCKGYLSWDFLMIFLQVPLTPNSLSVCKHTVKRLNAHAFMFMCMKSSKTPT